MSKEIKEKCGVFGVCGNNFDAARLVFFGLFALQHRGQESTGISSSNGQEIVTYKDSGLVAHVYSEEILKALPGNIAIGHNRYSTSGGSLNCHTQPVIDPDNTLALGHNGNLEDTSKVEEFLDSRGISINGLNDSELIHRTLLFHLRRGASLEDAIFDSFPLFDKGAFSIVVMTKNKLGAFRDRYGIRPLSLGRLNGGIIISSETCALDTVGANFMRDIQPGEMVIVDQTGIEKSYKIMEGQQRLEIFEFIYFARPDSMLMGVNVYAARYNMGVNLGIEHPIDADIIVPVPDSAIPAALGYSHKSGIPLSFALVKNRYIHRTFIEPEQHQRQQSVDLKLNPIPSLLRGKRVAVIDDSIVRGTTTTNLIRKTYIKGEAREVVSLIHSPPFKFPDKYGIDAQRYKELIAARLSIEEIREEIGASYLGYLSLEGLISAIGLPKLNLTAHVFDGIYPDYRDYGIKPKQPVIV